jgi:hypothetical protein
MTPLVAAATAKEMLAAVMTARRRNVNTTTGELLGRPPRTCVLDTQGTCPRCPCFTSKLRGIARSVRPNNNGERK